jgi:hypothetical protein
LDFKKVTKTERERAERLANSAAGAALEADVQEEANNNSNNINNNNTFVPGEGKSAEESFVTNFSPEEKERIRQLVANAKSPAEIEEIERSVRRGILPKGAEAVPVVNNNGDDDDDAEQRKRPASDQNGEASDQNGEHPVKKSRTGEEE